MFEMFKIMFEILFKMFKLFENFEIIFEMFEMFKMFEIMFEMYDIIF